MDLCSLLSLWNGKDLFADRVSTLLNVDLPSICILLSSTTSFIKHKSNILLANINFHLYTFITTTTSIMKYLNSREVAFSLTMQFSSVYIYSRTAIHHSSIFKYYWVRSLVGGIFLLNFFIRNVMYLEYFTVKKYSLLFKVKVPVIELN